MKQSSALYRCNIWIRNSWSYLALFALAAYFVGLAGRSVYRSYEAKQETQRLEAELRQADEEIDRLKALNAYYQTDTYKEKELRRTLLLKKPTERVYALPESSLVKEEAEGVAVAEAVSGSEEGTKKASEWEALPLWRQWVRYTTGR